MRGEAGESEKAVEVAWEEMEKGEGRMTELRNCLSERAKESGDRKGYLDLQFREAVWETSIKVRLKIPISDRRR